MKLNRLSYLAIIFYQIIIASTEKVTASLETSKIFSPIKVENETLNNVPSYLSEKTVNESMRRESNLDYATVSRKFNDVKYYEIPPTKYSSKLDNLWYTNPIESLGIRNESVRKNDYSLSWPTWSAKKEIYNNRNKKNRKSTDPFEDYLGLDSKLHEMSDRKYIHEHEGIFFPIHVPSHHHEKEDHLIPLLLLLLLPLLLFAIIIPLNANLLSTLFLIMQNNNGGTTTTAGLAPGRKKRFLDTSHPDIEEKILDVLKIVDKIIDKTSL